MKILLIICLLCVPVAAQQIGNPTTQQGVVPPRGVFAIRVNEMAFAKSSGPFQDLHYFFRRRNQLHALGCHRSLLQCVDERSVMIDEQSTRICNHAHHSLRITQRFRFSRRSITSLLRLFTDTYSLID